MTVPPTPPTSPAVSLAALSERERAVLRLLARGHTNKEIARELGLSQNVVEKILGNSSPYAVYPKIGVANAKSAIAWYLQQAEAVSKVEAARATELAPPRIPAAAAHTPEPSAAPEARKGPGAALFLTAFITVYVALVVLVFIPIWLQGGTGIVLIEWGNAYAVLPLMAGVYGLRHLRRPGPGVSPRVWRGLRWLSAGLVCWATGGVISILYSLVTKSATPYPSLADVCYVAQDLCFAVAFLLWWEEAGRRGAARRWLWLAIAAPALIGHLVLQYSGRRSASRRCFRPWSWPIQPLKASASASPSGC